MNINGKSGVGGKIFGEKGRKVVEIIEECHVDDLERNVTVSINPLINGPETNEVHADGDHEASKAQNFSCGMMEIYQDTNNPRNTCLQTQGKA